MAQPPPPKAAPRQVTREEVAPAPAKPEKAAAPPAAAEQKAAPRMAAAAPSVLDEGEEAILAARGAPGVQAAFALHNRLYSLAELGLKEGQVIDHTNVEKYRELVSPGREWVVKYGWRMRVTEARPIEMPRRYKEATERYSGQVELGPGGLSLKNYVAGQPFPHIDPNDPDAALKIIWNFYHNFRITDDFSESLFDGDTGTVSEFTGINFERHYIVDSLRRLHYIGRLYVDPKPNLPNPDGVYWKESLHPLIEPFDLKGVGVTTYRYLAPERHDDTWLYLPQLRRVRRMSTAQRSDALFGQDTDIDSFYGYNGHIAWSEWKLLGSQTILGVMHAKNVPVKWHEPEDWAFDDIWEPRPVWVLEARSKLPQYAYGKRIIYVDKQGWVVPYSDIYDRQGQLWKMWTNMYSFKRQEAPGAIVYEDEMPFNHAITVVDMQIAHASRAALPSQKATNLECHFFNQGPKGGTNEEFFTVAHLIEVGH